MRMTSTPSQRPGGRKALVHFTEAVSVTRFYEEDLPCIRITADGDRWYKLILTPDDILTFLLKLPPNSVAEAVANADDDEIDVSKHLPEVLKQLAIGAMAREKGD